MLLSAASHRIGEGTCVALAFALLVSCASAPSNFRTIQVGDAHFVFVRIPAGTFTMGETKEEGDPFFDRPEHKVTLSKAFWMQTTEVTQAQWKALTHVSSRSFNSNRSALSDWAHFPRSSDFTACNASAP